MTSGDPVLAAEYSEEPVQDLTEQQDRDEVRKTDTFLSSVMLLMILTVFQKGIGFVREIVVCRLLPPEELGGLGVDAIHHYDGLTFSIT